MLAAIHRTRQHRRALERGLLCRPQVAEAVAGVVEVHLGLVGRHARPGLGVEEVVGEAEVDERGHLADGLVHDAGEDVLGHVELLELAAAGELLGQRADEAVAADVDDGGVDEQADLERQAAVEGVVEEDDLVEGVDHLADALGDAADELVVGEDDDGGGGVAEGLRDGSDEAVAVDEDGVVLPVEERGREVALEVVEADAEVLERDHLEADVRRGRRRRSGCC
jgi:hypothetical protein